MTRPKILEPLALLLIVVCAAAMILGLANVARAEKSKAGNEALRNVSFFPEQVCCG
jgi:hypothetical protein